MAKNDDWCILSLGLYNNDKAISESSFRLNDGIISVTQFLLKLQSKEEVHG